jgi:hypothetical protein
MTFTKFNLNEVSLLSKIICIFVILYFISHDSNLIPTRPVEFIVESIGMSLCIIFCAIYSWKIADKVGMNKDTAFMSGSIFSILALVIYYIIYLFKK